MKRKHVPAHSAGHTAGKRGVSKQPKRITVTSVIGEVLLTISTVVLLFVVWQLWWTTFMVQSGMEQAVSDFQAANPAEESDTEPEHRTDAPPEVGEVAAGEVYGVVHVPEWNWMQIPLAEGTSSSVLDLGYAGHYSSTQQAGEVGNFAVAGHRRTYGNNFRRIDTLQAGDQVVVETADAYLIYQVTDHEIVSPTATDVLLPVPHDPTATATDRLMTMTTCHPEYGNSHRYIVYLELAYWTDKAEGVPAILKDEPEIGGEFTDDSALDGTGFLGTQIGEVSSGGTWALSAEAAWLERQVAWEV